MPGGVSFERVATSYDATRSLPPGVVRRSADVVARIVGKDRTLEVGVGTGRWAVPLETRGVRIVGVDLSAAMLGVARRKGFGRGLQGDVRSLPFRDATFTFVLSNHLLHLVYDVPRVLREFDRVATGWLVSVLEFETARPDLSAVYRELVELSGPRDVAPGLGERDLARRLVPDRVRDAAVFHQKSPASVRIDTLAARTFRDTWATPETLHRDVIDQLRQRFGDGEVVEETRVEVAEWSMARLRAFAATWGSTRAPPPNLSPP